jgi:hypothetical protein
MNLAAKFSKLPGDELGRAMLLEANLGVCVQVVPPGNHVVVNLIRCGICMVATSRISRLTDAFVEAAQQRVEEI